MIVSNSNRLSNNKISAPVEERNICCFLAYNFHLYTSKHQYMNLNSLGQQKWQCGDDDGRRTHFFYYVAILNGTFIIIQCKCACVNMRVDLSLSKNLKSTWMELCCLNFGHINDFGWLPYLMCVHCTRVYVFKYLHSFLHFLEVGDLFEIYEKNQLMLKWSDKKTYWKEIGDPRYLGPRIRLRQYNLVKTNFLNKMFVSFVYEKKEENRGFPQ